MITGIRTQQIMASSRIFIKGLPPTISEDDFKKHFSTKSEITDAKLIPHRRIGYVGYKTPEDAEKAVKYFNRSFIRMSKIGVELARPVSGLDLHLFYLTSRNRSLIPLYRNRGKHSEKKTAKTARLVSSYGQKQNIHPF
jgi:RNA recognition motif-containing protein